MKNPILFVLPLFLLASCSTVRVIDATASKMQIEKGFNERAVNHSGRILNLDSVWSVGNNIQLKGEKLTWKDTVTLAEKELPLSQIQSVEFVQKAGLSGSASSVSLGMIGGALTGLTIGAMTASQSNRSVDEEGEGFEGVGPILAWTTAGAIVGTIFSINKGSQSEAKTIYVFNSPKKNTTLAPSARLRIGSSRAISKNQSPVIPESHSDTSTIIRKETKTTQFEKPKYKPLFENERHSKGLFFPLAASAIVTGGSFWAYQKGSGAASAGVFIGPSLGNLLAGDKRRALIGFTIRAAAPLMYLIGMGITGGGKQDAFNYLGYGIFAGGVIYSFYTTPASVRDYNLRHGLSVTPMINPVRKSAGLAMNFQF